ncbi:uncharacterized protein LOC129583636 [Paramacrobiotus metropolitanus]|uniref:uncharacterized protein LOC129583636 n=1 Tax=Paramacrobiotus metropolitanus TaxID=2943436 RepID=UPI0024463A7F|nr:uncharacterized protein LOC129583636 [Paramacrobiotus metropolitanus]
MSRNYILCLPLPTIGEFFYRTASLVTIILQAVILDWYLIYYGSKTSYGWIAADCIVIATFVVSYVYADLYFKSKSSEKPDPVSVPLRTVTIGADDANKTDPNEQDENNRKLAENENVDDADDEYHKEQYEEICRIIGEESITNNNRNVAENIALSDRLNKARDDKKMQHLKTGRLRTKYNLGALPLAYISWAIYSSILIAKMLVILLRHGHQLDVKLLFKSNMLELAFVSTACVFAFVVLGHKQIPRGQEQQKTVIDYLTGRVLMDIIDSMELLDFVYESAMDSEAEKRQKMEPAVKYAILLFVSIQIFLPTIGLFQLSATNFAHDRPRKIWTMIHQMLNLFLENIPFLTIRIYLWSMNQFTESTFVFIVKNVFEITMNDWDFVIWLKTWITTKLSKREGTPPAAT